MTGEKTSKIDQFIGIYDNYLPIPFIDLVTKQFLEAEKLKKVYDRRTAENARLSDKKDISVNIDYPFLQSWYKEYSLLINSFREVVNLYYNETGILDYYNNISDFDFGMVKCQKTKPGEGYHVWHIEHSFGIEMSHRVLAFMIFLNDVEEGGETEFLHQKIRIKPKKGRCVIWPASFPYVHRGNPPLSGEKYILTSWLNIRANPDFYV